MALAASGCGHPAKNSASEQREQAAACATGRGRVALVLGARANTPAPRLTPAALSLVDTAIDGGQLISVVGVDGAPDVEFRGAFEDTGKNGSRSAKDHDTFVKSLTNTIHRMKAGRPEADLLAALAEAAGNVGPGGTVVVADSGLQTVAPLDFRRDGVLDAQATDVADFLKRQGSLPQLTGISVLFSGVGDTAPPQARLPLPEHKNLVAIWKAIAVEAGAECVAADPVPATGAAVPHTPAVSVVKVRPLETYPPSCGNHVLRNSGSVGFLPDTSVLRDRPAAAVALRELADWAVAHHAKIGLIGTTASAGTADGRRRLSLDRATAVRDVLVSLGVPAHDITLRGVGTRWPGHVQDLDSEGRLLPGPAERNRSVVLDLVC
ncbi:OmpA family protein [Streptomyces sp. NPDC003300]|uniref:OmpA family protein n=1 Tax=unclassified Streptomyces TaxID=2593676 RepID=UPI0033B74FB0